MEGAVALKLVVLDRVKTVALEGAVAATLVVVLVVFLVKVMVAALVLAPVTVVEEEQVALEAMVLTVSEVLADKVI